MSGLDPIWIVFAGLGGGLAGSIAGLASLVSYPALLAIGLSPISANVTNTVALVFSGAGTIWGSRPELVDQRDRAKSLVASAAIGGLAGGIALLVAPSKSFALVVPWFIGLSSVAVFVKPRPPQEKWGAEHRFDWKLTLGVFLIAIYGGYFGAAAGVVLISLLLFRNGDSFARTSALRNLLLMVSNFCAGIYFVAFGPVRWTVALPLAAGFFMGGRIGPMFVRRAPVRALQILIAVAGLGLAVHLGLDAYR